MHVDAATLAALAVALIALLGTITTARWTSQQAHDTNEVDREAQLYERLRVVEESLRHEETLRREAQDDLANLRNVCHMLRVNQHRLASALEAHGVPSPPLLALE